MNNQRIAGILIFAGVFSFSTAILIGEALRPAYSLNLDSISSLGVGSNGSIFYYSILFMGALVVISAAMLLAGNKKEPWHFTLALVGIGAIGVGIFPYLVNYPFHSDFAFLAFVFGGVTAVLFVTQRGTPLRVISPIVGIIIIVSIFLFATGRYYGLGLGGMERMIVYPTLFWALAISGHLMNQNE